MTSDRKAPAAVLETPWVRRAVERLAHELRLHHQPTADHSHRLASLAKRVAQRMGLDPLEIVEIELVAVLHDVGKLAVAPEILDYPGPLGPRERAIMARHTIEGEELLARTAGLEHLGETVRATHERFDGTGYPDGLVGEGIPLAARIVACADSFDAMTSSRAYRRALSLRGGLHTAALRRRLAVRPGGRRGAARRGARAGRVDGALGCAA
jgi:HD-GYP domain-containing protein (c-di-GMP phosphodiesterase class II)